MLSSRCTKKYNCAWFWLGIFSMNNQALVIWKQTVIAVIYFIYMRISYGLVLFCLKVSSGRSFAWYAILWTTVSLPIYVANIQLLLIKGPFFCVYAHDERHIMTTSFIIETGFIEWLFLYFFFWFSRKNIDKFLSNSFLDFFKDV